MPKEKKETITFHNTPSFYLEYTKNWLTHQKKKRMQTRLNWPLLKIYTNWLKSPLAY